MKFKTKDLLEELTQLTKENISAAEEFSKLSTEQLNYRQREDSWSILECLEHLNLYSDFYIPEIDSVIKKSKHQSSEIFKSGWLGNKFANDMKPKDKLNKMGTFKDKNPLGSSLDSSAIEKFINQQNQMLELIEKAKNVNLNKLRTKITLPILTFKLGDTFRFVIYHNQRHIVQAKKVLQLSNLI